MEWSFLTVCFRNRDAEPIRIILTDETDLLSVVDFGGLEVFEDTSSYIGCVVAQRRSPGDEPATHVRVINVNTVEAEFVAATLLNADLTSDEVSNDILRAYNASHPRGRGPWLLLSPADRRARALLSEASERLDAVAGVFQGIRTGANDIFIVEVESDEGGLTRVVNGLGDPALIESELLRPVAFGSEVQRYDIIVPKHRLLYPYVRGHLLSEHELRQKFPQAFKYLLQYRDVLSQRGSIAASGLRWYDLVRRRDEAWLTQGKLLIRDLATEVAFALDHMGTAFMVGGTAVVPQDSALLLPLLAYLNSSIANEVLAQITPEFRGKFRKFEPQHIQQIPVPKRILDDDAFAAEIARMALDVIAAREGQDIARQQEIEQQVDERLFDAIRAG